MPIKENHSSAHGSALSSGEATPFRARARIINQLGEQLIKNEAVALLELIKNAYDADAASCVVTMNHPDSPDRGQITILDDGEGMDKPTLQTAWLELGTSFKTDLARRAASRRTTRFHRLRLGEKGIGRLGVHRLGRSIEIVTRKADSPECFLSFDWDAVENHHFIDELKVHIHERPPKVFKSGSGTQITIKRLRVPWSRRMARDCARAVTSLNSPFQAQDAFSVSFSIPRSNWLDGILKFEDIEHYKLFSFDVTMSGRVITAFHYEFLPWPTMTKLKSHTVTLADREMQSLTRMQFREGRDYKDIDLSRHRIGEIRFRGIIFDLDARTLDLGVQDRSGLKKYLEENGGIRVFRDNMRVLDYGEPGNDWLDLGGRRINMPTKRISNNILLAAVYLSRAESLDLVEKANREGFVENAAYWELWRAVRLSIDRIESLRGRDKDLLRKQYGVQHREEPVISSIVELKEVIARKVKEDKTRQTLNGYLDRISLDYQQMTDVLIRSAGAGLNLVIVIHQIEKVIKEIRLLLKRRSSFDVLEERVQALSSLVEGYSILLRKSEKKPRDLRPLLDQCVANMQFRLEAHKITLFAQYQAKQSRPFAMCATDHFLNAMMNLVDNAIWWLGYSKASQPSILIDITDAIPGFRTVIVSDNGPGFTMPTEEAVKPFVSDKPGGMGIGLHLTDQIMQAVGGKLIFPVNDALKLPPAFTKGAIVGLAFPLEAH